MIDRRKGGRLPDNVIDLLLQHDIAEHGKHLEAAAPWVTGLDEVRRAVLNDMAFNLGVAGLLGFRNTLQAVKDGRYEEAAEGMMASRWAKQVKGRAVRLATMMRTGQWPPEIDSGKQD